MNYKPQKIYMEADKEYAWVFDQSVKFSSNVNSDAFICTCGKSKTAPYCDGSHIEYNAILARGGEQSLPMSDGEFDNGSR